MHLPRPVTAQDTSHEYQSDSLIRISPPKKKTSATLELNSLFWKPQRLGFLFSTFPPLKVCFQTTPHRASSPAPFRPHRPSPNPTPRDRTRRLADAKSGSKSCATPRATLSATPPPQTPLTHAVSTQRGVGATEVTSFLLFKLPPVTHLFRCCSSRIQEFF